MMMMLRWFLALLLLNHNNFCFSSSSSSSATAVVLLDSNDEKNNNDTTTTAVSSSDYYDDSSLSLFDDDDNDDEYFNPVIAASELWKEQNEEESSQQPQHQQYLRLQQSSPGGGLPNNSDQVKPPPLPRDHHILKDGINDIQCMYLSKFECQQIENAMTISAEHTRTTARRTHTTLKPLVILIQWQNHLNKQLIPNDHIERLWNANDINRLLYPSGSIKRYVLENSYSLLRINASIVDYTITNGTESYYADGRYGFDSTDRNNRPQLRQALYYVLQQLEAQGFDFNEFDQNNDLELDSVIFMHTGYDAANYQPDCNNINNNGGGGGRIRDRIWSHATSDNWNHDNVWISQSTGIRLGGYAITSVFRGACNANIVRVGILGHEFLHVLGLPDLYDADGSYNNNPNNVGGLGSYDIMSNPAGHDFRPKYPGFLSPWSKLELGWITPILIEEDGTYLARPSNIHPDIYIIRKNYQDGEYLLIENRQPISFDQRMRGGGILIYHIDSTTGQKIRSNGNRGFPSQENNWPQNGNHYPVALLQADGLYYIEQALRNQASGDFFHTDQHILRPGDGSNYPNTDSYVDGFIRSTGIIIDHFEETMEAGTWSFRVTFDEDFSYEPSVSPTILPSTLPTSIDDICHQIFEIKLKTDAFAHETSWELYDTTTGSLIDGDGNENIDPGQSKLEDLHVYEYWICLPNINAEYTFTIFDSYGDGMCDSRGCRGYWKLWLNNRIINEGDGDDLTYDASHTFTTIATSTST